MGIIFVACYFVREISVRNIPVFSDTGCSTYNAGNAEKLFGNRTKIPDVYEY